MFIPENTGRPNGAEMYSAEATTSHKTDRQDKKEDVSAIAYPRTNDLNPRTI
jgi:hypothetical protein